MSNRNICNIRYRLSNDLKWLVAHSALYRLYSKQDFSRYFIFFEISKILPFFFISILVLLYNTFKNHRKQWYFIPLHVK